MSEVYLSIIDVKEKKNKVELLYITYRKFMFYIAKQVLCDDTLAEDAVQDTFIKIIEISDEIREIYCHKTKCLTAVMVKNHAINLYNKRKKRHIVPFEEIEHIIFGNTNILYEGESSLMQAVAKLPDIYRDIMTLKYYRELSNSDIAGLLNVSEATVRKRLQRAKNKIKLILKEEIYENTT